MKLPLRVRLVATILGAVAGGWFWALAPMTTSLVYIHPSGWTDADLVRHLWNLPLIQPAWVGGSPQSDYLRWTQAEAIARLAVVLLAWLATAGFVVGRHQRVLEAHR